MILFLEFQNLWNYQRGFENTLNKLDLCDSSIENLRDLETLW